MAADYEIKILNWRLLTRDHLEYARQLINKITASGYFELTQYTSSYTEALLQQTEKDKADGFTNSENLKNAG